MCQSTLKNINCSDVQHGYPVLPGSLQKTVVQPNGTASTFSNQGGSMTAAPYGSTTIWNFIGTATPLTATAVPYKAVKQGSASPVSGSASASGSSAQKSAASNCIFDLQLTMTTFIVILVSFGTIR